MTRQDLKDLKRFADAYSDYCDYEFASYNSPSEERWKVKDILIANDCGVMYTTSAYDEEYGIGDDDAEFQASYILKDKVLRYWIDGVLVREERFENYGQMADDLENADFQAYFSILNRRFYQLLEDGVIVPDYNQIRFTTTENIVEVID